MPMIQLLLLCAAAMAPLIAHADPHPACRAQLIRYCISMYASWDMPPTLANCIAAMEPGPGVTPAWYALRGEIAGGTIPPLARYQRCLAANAAAPAKPHPRP